MAVISFNQAYLNQLKEVISLLNQSMNSLKEATHLAYTLGEYTGTGDARDLLGKQLSKEIDGHMAHIKTTLVSAEHAEQKVAQGKMASSMDRIAFLEARIASLQARIASDAKPVNLKTIMNAVEKHLKTNHKGLEGWGDWEGDGSLFQCTNESKGLHLALEVKAKGKDGMQADIQITTNDEDDEILVETAQIIHADMTDEASVIEAIHDFMVTQAKHASSHHKSASFFRRTYR